MPKNSQLNHLAVIMDGNRRWAKSRGLPTLEGHRRGYDKMKKVTKWCIEDGVKILTVYAFSTENWNRSKKEVGYLMNLLRSALSKDVAEMHNQGVKIKVIGQVERLDTDLQALVRQAENKTKNNKELLLQIAISYGGQQEIVQAVKKIVKAKTPANKIDEELISKHLWTSGVQNPDLIVRTSGEHRLSNFLTWQSAYSEFLFVKKHWPAFSQKDFKAALSEFYSRQRRFGA